MSEIETREMVTSYSSAENEFKIQRERKLELESELEMLKVENEEKIHQVETGAQVRIFGSRANRPKRRRTENNRNGWRIIFSPSGI